MPDAAVVVGVLPAAPLGTPHDLSMPNRNEMDGDFCPVKRLPPVLAIDQTIGMPIYWPAWKPD
jgi:hypothetical protein